ncbi:MAG: NADH:ubiquinone reductase (Na(+)-transporting) subunit A, partial [Gammaproteobacteria bacterium]
HHIEDFNFGLEVISHIPKNCVHISTSIDNNLSKITSDKIRYHEFEGLHPVGLVGTQIHRISPVSINKTVWTINYQDVAMIGKLFKSGSIDASRTVALCGPQVEDPCLVKTEIGASISEITSGNTLDGNNRFISGSVLCGREANSYTNYLGRYNAQVSVLREVEKEDREFLNFLRPGLQKHSVLPVFFTKLKEKLLKLNYTTAMNGADRAIVPIGIFEDIFPFNIMITQLLKSIVIGDTELAQKLGILELDEEDLALCTYACPSKYDYGSLLREMLTKIEEEG